MRKHWVFGRLHILAGDGDIYGVEVSVDFIAGWALTFRLWNFWVCFEVWSDDR